MRNVMIGVILCALIHLGGEICNKPMQTPFAYEIENNSREGDRAALLFAYGSSLNFYFI
jgi:hypothetical protein